MNKYEKITIIGDGGWGTALSIELAKNSREVSLWSNFPDYAKRLRDVRINDKFLKDIRIPDAVCITCDMKEALSGAGLVILAVPSKYFRDILQKVGPAVSGNPIFVSAAKGIETGVLMRMSEVCGDVLGKDRKIAALSGPSIAIEVAKGFPATIVAASKDLSLAETVQRAIASERLRVYTSDDIIGVELGGSLKNIIAIAAGMSDSLGFGTNSKAAILTRGMAEISRLGIAMGARSETFAGLSGMGDLITTCISRYSRNRWFGEMLGSGGKAEDIIRRTEMVVEGVTTAKSARDLSIEYKIDMPISAGIYSVIYEGKDPKKAVRDLMARTLKPEVY